MLILLALAEDLFDYAARRSNENNPMTVAESASIIMEVAEIMIPLHASKVVHRNIKLGNILRRKSDG
jgi:serine/threonine protein kinase